MATTQSKRVTVEISDPELLELLEESDNQSKAVRAGLRRLMNGDEALSMSDLSKDERDAYQYLADQEGRIELDTAETNIAQLTQIDKELVRRSVIRPLANAGLLDVDSRLWGVDLVTVPPVECAFCEADVPPERLQKHIRQNHSVGGSQ